MSNSMPDNVFETTTTTGTGAYTPAGAVTGSRTFLAALGAGTIANVQYVCRDDSNIEVGIGTWNGSTLTRDTILYSTNSNAAVNWGIGTRNLFITISSEICLKELAVDVASTGTPITALDHTGCLVVRITGSTATTIQGISAPKGSKLLIIQSPSTAVITLKHQNTSASAANRMILPRSSDYTIPAGGASILMYDITQSRWIEIISATVNNYISSVILPATLGSVYGLSVSNNGSDPNNDIDIATGAVTSIDATRLSMILSSSLTKRSDAAWAAGTGSGGWLEAGSKPTSSTIHLFLIGKSDGTVDAGFSNSLTPTLPSGYTGYRRISSHTTNGSGNIRATTKVGNLYFYTDPTADYSGNPGTGSRTTVTLTVPTGIAVEAICDVSIIGADAVYITALSQTDTAASTSSAYQTVGEGNSTSNGAARVNIPTNTSGQIGIRSASGGTARVLTHGWRDFV